MTLTAIEKERLDLIRLSVQREQERWKAGQQLVYDPFESESAFLLKIIDKLEAPE